MVCPLADSGPAPLARTLDHATRPTRFRYTVTEAYEAIGTELLGWGNRDIDQMRADFEAAVVTYAGRSRRRALSCSRPS